VSGLLINDISDHLPIFTVYDSNYILNRHGIKPISKRVRTEETMEAFKVDLLAQDWEFIGNEKDVDKAYEEFLRIFKLLYMIKISQLKYIAGNKNKMIDRGFPKDYKMPVKRKIHFIENSKNIEL